jgi:ribosomal protein S18 acetylase RimI-like enzyme
VADLALQPFTDDDLEFLYEVYAGTRQDELAVVDWTDEQQEQFLRMQFHAQHTHYQQHYAHASFDVIELDGVPIGRLYLLRDEAEFRIVDIALLPEYRGRGLGGRLLDDVLSEADRAALPVSIHVEHDNPAMRLYARLGFVQVDDNGVYHLMRRAPRSDEGQSGGGLENTAS